MCSVEEVDTETIVIAHWLHDVPIVAAWCTAHWGECPTAADSAAHANNTQETAWN